MSIVDILDAIGDSAVDNPSDGRVVYFNPRTLVTAVYDGEHSAADVDDSDKTEAFNLLPGQIEISTRSIWQPDGTIAHTSRAPAWVVMPFGLRPDMDEDQKGTNRVERTSNQNYGFYAMPRVGDMVFVIGYKYGQNTSSRTFYYVFGVMGSTGASHPPPVDNEDMQIVHRSGASIRLNDTYAGGGTITTTGGQTGVSDIKGVTGNLTMVGNRTMLLAGKKYLPHGLLSKYGDPRSHFSQLKIQTYSTAVTDAAYTSLFANTEDDTYYDPITESTIGSGNKFLSPPSTDDSIIPLTDNTLLLSQHGGGAFRIDDHNTDADYSRMTLTSASLSIMVGQEYQELGRAGKSTNLTVDGIGEGEWGDVGTGLDTIEIQHKAGTRITVDENGQVYIYTADPNAKVIIDTKEDSATIDIGMANKPAVKEGDETYTGSATGQDLGMGSTNTIGNLGIPVPHLHGGHTHDAKATQEKVYI